MNLPTSWQELTNSPLIVAFLVLIGATILVTFIVPFVFKIVKNTKLPKHLGFVKTHPKYLFVTAFVILIAIFGFYVYYYINQPVRIITAAQLKLEKGRAIELTQQGPSGRSKADFYLLDVRSRSEYAVEHLKGSASVPAETAIKQSPVSKLDVVVYSTASRFDEARKVANVIKKKGSKGMIGKIYLIKDGFEGLEKAGLLTESGIWD